MLTRLSRALNQVSKRCLLRAEHLRKLGIKLTDIHSGSGQPLFNSLRHCPYGGLSTDLLQTAIVSTAG